MLEQERALVAAMTFLPRQGASTRFARVSQVMPKEFCRAWEAALSCCSRLPPASPVMAAAAMLAPEPHSAMQPATSAAKVE